MVISKCETCWKSFIWACPILIHIPKNIISCTAYEPNDACIKSQELIDNILDDLKNLIYREWDEILPSGGKIHHIRILNYKYEELIKKYEDMKIR